MKYILSCLLITVFILPSFAQVRSEGGRGGPSGGLRPVDSGPLPDLNAYTATGEPIKVRDLIDGKYTVLSALPVRNSIKDMAK